MNRKLLMFLLLLFIGIGNALAQRTITGKVTGADGDAILGATVAIKGSTIGTISGMDGSYHLNIPANVNNDTIVFSYIGKLTVMEPINGRTTINVVMQDDDVNVEEVVVTALGISRKEKTLGYAATKVDSDEIVNAKTSNVADALAGKVAGVRVSATSSNPGSLSNIVIRGFSSVTGSNQPLYVVDGIPITNRQADASVVGVSMSAGGISNISANDIESLTVLKGAAATALYGSRAANGVILITTKQGKKAQDKNFVVEYNGSVMARRVSLLPDFQNDFGQGWQGMQTFIENGSWGPRLDGSRQLYGPIYDGKQLSHIYDAKEDNILNFFETGWSQSHSISINGASDDNKVNYYLSYAINDDNGFIPGDFDTYNRNTIAAKTTYKATDWLTLSSSVNFARSKSNIVNTDNEGGLAMIDCIYQTARDIEITDKDDLDNPFNTPEAYFTPYGASNPYWVLENNYFRLDTKEVFGKVQADINPIKNLTVTYRFSYDYSDYDDKYGAPKMNVSEDLMWDNKGYPYSEQNTNGQITSEFSKRKEINHDILATWADKYLDDRLDVSITAGVNVNERSNGNLIGMVSDLSIEKGFWNLSNGATKQSLTDDESKRRLVGILGDVTIGWNDMVYLGYSVRNDRSSTLPINNNSYSYQGVTASFIFTNLLPKNNILSFGKVRLAYGSTGNDAGVYFTADNTYTQAYSHANYVANAIQFPVGGVNAYQKLRSMGNPNLKPEMTTELEGGLNLMFYNGRIGVDFAAYTRKTKDQIFQLPIDPASGYEFMYVNYGEVQNKGIELVLNTVPVKIGDFSWNLDFNFAKNVNEVISLPKELEGGKSQIRGAEYSTGAFAVYMYAEEGKPFGEFYCKLPTYDPEGHIIVDENGAAVLTSTEVDTDKNIQPDFTGGVKSTFNWKGLSLSGTLDFSKGGYMFSRTIETTEFVGNSIYTVYNSRNPFIIPNSVINVGTSDKPQYVENTVPMSMSDYTMQDLYFGNGGVDGCGHYLVSRSYAKLRNITLSYTLPKNWIAPVRLSEVTLGVFCNNVFTWTDKHNRYTDPENSTFGYYGDLAAQFGEQFSNPSCRIWGLNLNVKF